MRENRQSGSEGGGTETNRFSLPLYGLLIHAHHRMFRVQRPGVNSQDFLHGGREICV